MAGGLISTEEAASILGVSPSSLNQFSRRLEFALVRERKGREPGRLLWGEHLINRALKIRSMRSVGVAVAIEEARID